MQLEKTVVVVWTTIAEVTLPEIVYSVLAGDGFSK